VGSPRPLASDDPASSLARLVGDRVVILHSPAGPPAAQELSGKDVDCAVSGLDPWWPLRLPKEWRLCQFSQYDLRGWFWVLDRKGELLHLDTIDDSLGLGRDGFPTTFVRHTETTEASPALRATYLALKRLRKGIRADVEWARIRMHAGDDWVAFRSCLERMAGPRLARMLDEFVREAKITDDRRWHRARALQVARRFRTPSRTLMAGVHQVRRIAGRLAQPTGWVVLIVGPDGSGKSTLAQTLIDGFSGVFRRDSRLHWRPGVLPRPGALIGRAAADPTTPHARQPHGRVISLALLVYTWADFAIGGWLRIWPLKLRTALVVWERGWWDLEVDPRRYRLDVPSWLVRLLGRLIPHPNAVFVLNAAPSLLMARKAELPEEELRRQLAAWRPTIPKRVPTVRLDASGSFEEVATEARAQALRMLEGRAVSRLGSGWTQIGVRTTRWWLPRGPWRTAVAGLNVYQPIAPRSRVGWEMARATALLGAFRLLPRGAPPPREVREALAPHIPPRSTIAVSRANHPGRYIAAIVDDHGRCRMIAKIATETAGKEALRREAEAIDELGHLLVPPVAAPRILANEPGLLLLKAVSWRSRARPWRLEEEVARALGAFFRNNADANGALAGAAHGDCAPWNLLRTEDGWVLVDWEAVMESAPPFYDLCHYMIQGHTLLGRPQWGPLMRGFKDGAGWVGAAVRAYAEGAGLEAENALEFLGSYLQRSRSIKETEGDFAGGRTRFRLLHQLAK
jgi:hypothetical protein